MFLTYVDHSVLNIYCNISVRKVSNVDKFKLTTPKQTMMVYEIAVKLTGRIYFALLTVISKTCGTTLRKSFKTEYHSMFPNKKKFDV